MFDLEPLEVSQDQPNEPIEVSGYMLAVVKTAYYMSSTLKTQRVARFRYNGNFNFYKQEFENYEPLDSTEFEIVEAEETRESQSDYITDVLQVIDYTFD